MSGGTRRGASVAAFGIAARAVTQVVVVAITIVAARYLDPTNFGIFSLAAILTVLGRTLLYVGAYEYLMKSDDPEIYSSAGLVLNVSVALLFGTLLVIFGSAAAPFLGGEIFLGLLVILAPSNLLAAVSAWQEALILRDGKLTRYYAVTIMAEVAAGAMTIALFELGWGVSALVVQLYIRAILLSAGFAFVDRPVLGRMPSRQSLGVITTWSRHRYAAVFTNYLSNYAADFIIGVLLSPGATGLYRTGSRIVTAASDLFAQPANLVCRSVFSRQIRDPSKPADVWPDALFVFGLLSLPALAGLAVLSNEIVEVFLGPTWQGAAQVIATLCLARAFAMVPAILGPLLIVHDRQRTVFLIQTFAAAATVVMLLWTARLGLLPAAITVAVVQGIVAVLMLMRIPSANGVDQHRLIKIGGCIVLTTLLVAGAAQAVINAMPSRNLSAVLLAVAAGAIVWCSVAFALRRSLARSLRSLQ